MNRYLPPNHHGTCARAAAKPCDAQLERHLLGWTRRLGLVALFVAALFFATSAADAFPATAGSGNSEISDSSSRPLLAKKRKRRRRRRAKRRRSRRRRSARRSRRKQARKPRRPRKASSNFPRRAAPEKKAATSDSAGVAPASGALRRGARVEFDGRLVKGQTAKSGAIYLFARKRSQLRSMVEERVSYRKEILRSVYPKYDDDSDKR
jgi:hypothetical protein